MRCPTIRAMIGTAGWSIPRSEILAFPGGGHALERYARVFNAVEVNSSFYRPHRASTWAKWAALVPTNFRFAVKIPKTITHQAMLVDVESLIAPFAKEVAELGQKLAVLLVQLPPKFRFEAGVASRFFDSLRSSVDVPIVCEPRNASWFDSDADAILKHLEVARAAADPALSTVAGLPGGWLGLHYWRLHGSPVMYRSPYGEEKLEFYAGCVNEAVLAGARTWCMLDNTAASAAIGDARSMLQMTTSSARGR